MKKLLLLLVPLLLLLQQGFGQGVSLDHIENTDCGILQSVDLYLDVSQLTGDTVEYWEYQGTPRTVLDTINVSLHCGVNYIGGIGVHFKSGQYTQIKGKNFEKQCPDFFGTQIGFLDSASQKASFNFRFNDSTQSTHTVKKAFLSTFMIADVQGRSVNIEIDSSTLFGKKGLFGKTNTLNLQPGQYRVNYNVNTIYNGNNCVVSNETYFHIGHLNKLSIREGILINSSIFNNHSDSGEADTSSIIRMHYVINDSIYYWDKRGIEYCQLINWWANIGCIDTNIFFISPDSNEARVRWAEVDPNYSKPAISEEVYYDYNSDGTIDRKASDFDPKARRTYAWKATKTPADSSNMGYHLLHDSLSNQQAFTTWSRDSIGQWVKSEQLIDACKSFRRRDTVLIDKANYSLTIKQQGSSFLNVIIYKYDDFGSTKKAVKFVKMSPLQYAEEFTYTLDTADYLIRTFSENYRCDSGRSYKILLSTGKSPINLSKHIQVYPSIGSNHVHLKTNEKIDLQNWSVLDLSGKVLLTQQVSSNNSNVTMDITSLASGTYIVHIETKQGMLNERITKL